MKKIILILALGARAVYAQTNIQAVDISTVSTNPISGGGGAAQITITGICTNTAYSYTNHSGRFVGDTLPVAFGKINNNFTYVQSGILSNSIAITLINNQLTYFGTNSVTNNSSTANLGGTFSGNGQRLTINGTNLVTGTVNSNALDAATLALLGSGGGALPTNVVMSSVQYTAYNTNFAFWATSNYIGRVANISRFGLNPGNDGGNPPMAEAGSVVGSYDGTTSWFTLTNGFQTTNAITVAVLSAGSLPQPGGLLILSVDHPELVGKVNGHFGQHDLYNDPIDPREAATKNYTDNKFASAFNNNWSTTISGNTNHFVYSYFGAVLADFANTINWVPITSTSVDGTGTNFIINAYQTNFVSGWELDSSTNLAVSGSFTIFTNYTVVTNTGVVTLTVPLDLTEPMRFFSLRASSISSITFNAPVTMAAGTLYPSNTWNLASITNGMGDRGFWTGNSNGLALVSVSVSNGVVRIKQLAP
jgi:hypothetical protein